MSVNSSGTVTYSTATSGSAPASYQWIQYRTASDYEIRLTVLNGSAPTSGTVGSWLALSSDRAWQLTQSGSLGFKNGEYRLEIRLAATGVVLTTATVTMAAAAT